MGIEENVIRRAREGDRTAMEEIWRELYKTVYRYAWWSTSSREDAEDITSETFYRAFRHLDRFDPGKASLATWIMRIARNLVIDARRKEARHPRGQMEEEAGARDEMVEDVEEDEERHALRLAMEELTEEQRQVLVMKYMMDMGNREIAVVMGRREGAVNALHHRALRKLGRILEGGYVAANREAATEKQDRQSGLEGGEGVRL